MHTYHDLQRTLRQMQTFHPESLGENCLTGQKRLTNPSEIQRVVRQTLKDGIILPQMVSTIDPSAILHLQVTVAPPNTFQTIELCHLSGKKAARELFQTLLTPIHEWTETPSRQF